MRCVQGWRSRRGRRLQHQVPTREYIRAAPGRPNGYRAVEERSVRPAAEGKAPTAQFGPDARCNLPAVTADQPEDWRSARRTASVQRRARDRGVDWRRGVSFSIAQLVFRLLRVERDAASMPICLALSGTWRPGPEVRELFLRDLPVGFDGGVRPGRRRFGLGERSPGVDGLVGPTRPGSSRIAALSCAGWSGTAAWTACARPRRWLASTRRRACS